MLSAPRFPFSDFQLWALPCVLPGEEHHCCHESCGGVQFFRLVFSAGLISADETRLTMPSGECFYRAFAPSAGIHAIASVYNNPDWNFLSAPGPEMTTPHPKEFPRGLNPPPINQAFSRASFAPLILPERATGSNQVQFLIAGPFS